MSSHPTIAARLESPDSAALDTARSDGAGRRRSRRFLAALFAVAAIATAVLPGCLGASMPSLDTPSLQQPVPATLLADDGSPVGVPLPGARSVVIHFWSPANEACKKTIPAVVAKRAEMQAKGATLMLVAVMPAGQTANDAKATLALWGIDERFAIDVEGAYFRKIGAHDVPAFAVVDAAAGLPWLAPTGVTTPTTLAPIRE